mmetsp:Transcript_37560/g.95384  ORF Transcript_37560/g.95384 Transcript_37560/m.95384 type:complete len:238 (+) Transcript_37560:144-857(+)
MRPVGAAGGRELADVLLHIPELGGVRGGVAAVHHAGRLEEVAVELVPRLPQVKGEAEGVVHEHGVGRLALVAAAAREHHAARVGGGEHAEERAVHPARHAEHRAVRAALVHRVGARAAGGYAREGAEEVAREGGQLLRGGGLVEAHLHDLRVPERRIVIGAREAAVVAHAAVRAGPRAASVAHLGADVHSGPLPLLGLDLHVRPLPLPEAAVAQVDEDRAWGGGRSHTWSSHTWSSH